MHKTIETIDIKPLLPLVRKPSRYIGGEVNSIRKDLSRVRLTFGLAFPDAYEVGMSHLGIQILYQVLNSREDIACERVFAPWKDMETLLRGRRLPLITLESGIPLNRLDILGVSIQYELSYTNILNMLDLGGIPLLSSERGERDPIVIGGGPAVFNPEPIADFFDAFFLGDGEKGVLEIADTVIECREKGLTRGETLKRLSNVPGIYIPSFFKVEYHADGTVSRVGITADRPPRITKRFVADINRLPLPARPVLPFMETIHDRVTVEIARGCTRGCRFCQAGMIYRPSRERRPELVLETIDESLKATGYNEVSLLSLSTGDYTLIEDLLTGLMQRLQNDRVAVSLPSLRVGTLSAKVASEIRKVRKTGFTFAPEAGSERLRQFINKGIREEDLLAAAKDIFSLGWNTVKLYFMIGLPTETEEDLDAIVALADCVKMIGKSVTGRYPTVNVSVSTFIPKPFTPFQWEPQITSEEARARQDYLRKSLTRKRLGFKWHDPGMSVLEGVFSRGDRRLSRVIERAYRKGARFDGWSEEFKPGLWEEALREEGVETAFYTARRRSYDEILPWEHLDPSVRKQFLIAEYEQAASLGRTPDCKTDKCSNCGVCDHKIIRNRTVEGEEVPSDTLDRGGERDEFYRVRFHFAKTGGVRFLSHLETISAIVRAVRRAGLPVRYSQGFHPLPKVTFASPLPVGLESTDEYMDIEFLKKGGELDAVEITERLNAELPEGFRIMGAAHQPLKLPFPSDIMTEYLAFLKNGPKGFDIEPDRIEGLLRDFCAKDSLPVRVEKEGKFTEIDIRPQIAHVSMADSALRLVLKKGAGPSVRPHDAVACLLGLSKEDASLIPILKTGSVQNI